MCQTSGPKYPLTPNGDKHLVGVCPNGRNCGEPSPGAFGLAMQPMGILPRTCLTILDVEGIVIGTIDY